jgi:hypothetical protein
MKTQSHLAGTPKHKTLNFSKFRADALVFIESNINDFPLFLSNSSFDANGLPKTISVENKITQKIVSFFNSKLENGGIFKIKRNEIYTFHFGNQSEEETGHRSNDASIVIIQKKPKHKEFDRILCIEAKRLPTPGSRRKKEYVEGNLGGIERFKMGVHSSELPEAIMLAYIQTHDATHWHTQVNTWIDEQITTSSNTELTWAAQDKLQHTATLGAVEKYHSKHERINSKVSNDIELHHYWLNLTNN